MRFSVAATSLISLVLGSSAVSALDPAYVRTWGIQADPHGRLTRGAPPVVFDGGQVWILLLLQLPENSNMFTVDIYGQ